jgi:branched-chain amino acid transport system ATP-binding protein
MSSTSGRISNVAEVALEVNGLNAYYGHSHVLQGVTFTVEDKPVAIIGRNGMGKSTLCLSMMGMIASVSGSVRFNGRELMGKPSYKIAQAGLGFVPQGRRVFQSLTTDEHLRIVPRNGGSGWTPSRVYKLFPRLADRKHVGAAQLSGGEQQMLAIGRALLTNPKLLIMDEPSEGLAPKLIEDLIASVQSLTQEGMGLLLVEQRLGVAAALADRQLVMVGGQIVAETTAAALINDPVAQQRYLGVEPMAASPT